MARPTKLTDEIQERIVEAIRAGNTNDTAAEYAGIHRSTLYRWMRRGTKERDRLAANPGEELSDDERRFCDFCDAIKKAGAEAEARNVAIINKAASGYPVKKTSTRTRSYLDENGRQVTETITTTAETHEFIWQAAAWYLERRHPERWSRRRRVTLEGGDEDRPLRIEEHRKRFAEMSAKEIADEYMRRIRGALGSNGKG